MAGLDEVDVLVALGLDNVIQSGELLEANARITALLRQVRDHDLVNSHLSASGFDFCSVSNAVHGFCLLLGSQRETRFSRLICGGCGIVIKSPEIRVLPESYLLKKGETAFLYEEKIAQLVIC